MRHLFSVLGPHVAGGARELSGVSFIRARNQICSGSFHPPNTITLGIRFQHRTFGGTHIQSVAYIIMTIPSKNQAPMCQGIPTTPFSAVEKVHIVSNKDRSLHAPEVVWGKSHCLAGLVRDMGEKGPFTPVGLRCMFTPRLPVLRRWDPAF